MTARIELPLIADEIIHHVDAIVHRWYDAWRHSDRSYRERSESALDAAENPDQMWKMSDRLDPEARVVQNVPLEAGKGSVFSLRLPRVVAERARD